MRYGKFLSILVFAVFAACSADPEPLTGPGGSDGGTGGSGGGGGGGDVNSGVVIVDLVTASASGQVGTDVVVTANAWLNSAKTTPVTDGTVVSFSITGAAGSLVLPSSVNTSAGAASVSVRGVEPGAANIAASVLGVDSSSVTITFEAAPSVAITVSQIRVQPLGQSNVLVADSESTDDEIDIVISVTGSDGQPYAAGVTVDVTTTTGSLSARKVVTDINGSATVRFTAGTVAGTATIRASVGSVSGQATVDIGPGAPVQIVIADPSPTIIGVRGSSAQESSVVSVSIKDIYGNAVSDNTMVNFELVPVLAGASLLPLVAGTINGTVTTVINSGTKSGSMSVVATLPVANRSVASNKITVFGGPPGANHFQLVYTTGELVLPGFGIVGVETTLSLKLTDRYNNPVAPGTQIYATCEAGVCGSNDPSGIATDANGNASFTFATAFGKYEPFGPVYYHGLSAAPVDFGPPIGQQHSWPILGDRRNGYIAVMAHSIGESAYHDINANGVFDLGTDSLVRVPSEPFLNRDSAYAFTEPVFTPGVDEFHDFNGNGTFDINGIAAGFQERQYVWDELQLIYSTPPVLYYVPNQFLDFNGDGIFDPFVDVAVAGGPIPPAYNAMLVTTLTPFGNVTGTMDAGNFVTTSTSIYVYMGDENANPLPTGSVISFDGLEEGESDFIKVTQPSVGARTYSADRTTPKEPVAFRVQDEKLAITDETWRSICFSMTYAGVKYTECATVLTF